MSTYRLDRLLAPRSIALVGGSPRPKSLGRAVLRNLREAGFAGPIHLVNPNHPEIDGIRAVKAVADLAGPLDLLVVTVPPQAVPAVIEDGAKAGAAAAVILTAGLGRGPGSLSEQVHKIARAHGMRLVGPNCLGVIAPAAKLNASFAAQMPLAGDLALISQSGAIATGMVDWGVSRSVGFSAIVSIGDKIDVDFGDLLDYFALDPKTRAILLYIESINDARKFMSAARAAARSKPVVVVKSGRHTQGAKAAATHTGALAGSDEVYDAAFQRAGLLRVLDLGELFDAAETLGRVRKLPGRRLAILTNGGGIGVLAVDRLADLGGTLAGISPDARARLDAAMPPTWSKANPIDIVGDADPARYQAALETLLSDPDNDAVLVMNVQTALAPAIDIAGTVAQVALAQAGTVWPSKPVFAVWVGAAPGIADIFNNARIPHFPTEGDAIRGFMHLVRHDEAIRELMETPPSVQDHFVPDVDAARRVIGGAIADGRTWLDPVETADLLNAYAIPIAPVRLAADPNEAERIAAEFLAAGASVAIKIMSQDITHKSDVGGVRLNITSPQAAREAAEGILARARAARPDARITGVTVHPMIVRPHARELIAGLADDPTFGPIIVFGRGGTAVEVIADKALALPPLDMRLARTLIARTRVARRLAAYRDIPAADLDETALVLLKLAQLAADLPEVREIDVNPLLADENGVIAVDARVAIGPVEARFKGPGHPRFAVRPYPSEWERHIEVTKGWTVFVRPIRPEDEDAVRAFLEKISLEDLRLRFFAPIKEFGHAFVARLTQLDYARAMALVAIDEATGDFAGVVRLHSDANYESGEYAILLRSDLKGRGLGWTLMQLIIDYARKEGLKRITGQVLRQNVTMLRMCSELGFRIEDDPEQPSICVATLNLA